MSSKQPVLLLYSPPCDPTQSYTSLPTLTGHLRRNGIQVVQRDLGIEILDDVLTDEFLVNAKERALTRRQDHTDADYQRRLGACLAAYDHIIGHIGEAKRVMRDPSCFYDMDSYRWATNLIERACDLASLPNHPARLTPSQYSQSEDCTVGGLLTATDDKSGNFFAEYFDERFLANLLKCDPALIGISVTYHFQILPAFTLARKLRSIAPRIPIVIGGAVIARMESHLLTDHRLFNFADYFVVGEGETALLELARCAMDGQPASPGIPNTIQLIEGAPEASTTSHIEELTSSSLLDFNGLELERYLSPEPVFLMPASRGCYWGKCTFCDVSRQTRTVYRPIKRSAVVSQMKMLRQRFGGRRFFFCDDAVPLGVMKEVASAVIDEMPDATWQAEARLEKGMDHAYLRHLADGGCRQLMFGYESSSQRMLDQMKKNNSIERDEEIILNCHAFGIGLNLQTFIGLPTETSNEALATVDFLKRHEDKICSIGFGQFSLYKDTPIYNFPEEHGVENIRIPLKDNLLSECDFDSLSGMTRDEVSSLYDGANAELRNIYKTRSLFLGGAAGSHSLLHLSHASFQDLNTYWSALDTKTNISALETSQISISEDARYASSGPFRYLYLKNKAQMIELSEHDEACLQNIAGACTLDELLDRMEHEKGGSVADTLLHMRSCEKLLQSGALTVA